MAGAGLPDRSGYRVSNGEDVSVGREERRFRIAVLLSGTGRTLQNLIDRRERGALAADISVVISSRPNVRGLDIARTAGIETGVVTRRQAPTPFELSAAVKSLIEPHGVDLIVLAGYLLRLEILPEWEERVINIHPSLLPLFGGHGMYGSRVHQAVLDSGMKVSGCTVHIVNNEYDAGPILLQRCVPVAHDDDVDSLATRVFDLECDLYPEAINLFAAKRVRVSGDSAWTLPSADGIADLG